MIIFCLFHSKAGLLRTAPVTPANSSPTIQRAANPTVPQKTQPIPAAKPAADASKMAAMASGSYEEDPCVICHEDMNASLDIVTLECGHQYHSAVRLFWHCYENHFRQILWKVLKWFTILFIQSEHSAISGHVAKQLPCWKPPPQSIVEASIWTENLLVSDFAGVKFEDLLSDNFLAPARPILKENVDWKSGF